MPHMGTERKNTMVSARLPETLVERVDFIVRNVDTHPYNRSAAVQLALEAWLPAQEQRLTELGILQKKTR